MRNIATLVVLTFGFLASATAQGVSVLDLPVHDQWVKVHSGDEIVQWSIITASHPTMRADYIVYRDIGGGWKNYYMIRSQCANGNNFAVSIIKPEHKVGFGKSCDGDTVQTTDTQIKELPLLPAEATISH